MIQFSQEDVKDPVRLERVLRQFQTIMEQAGLTGDAGSSPKRLAMQLAPLIRDQLQVSGSAPMNLQSLLPLSSLPISSVTLTLFKITGGGTNGSITFNSSGIITAYVQPT